MNQCQVCPNEEDLRECPKCKRYTCESCFKDFKEKGMENEICPYCGYSWYTAPEEVDEETNITAVTPAEDIQLITPSEYRGTSGIGWAPEDSYNRDFRVAREQVFGELQGQTIRPGDLVTQESSNAMGEVTSFVAREQIVFKAAQGKLWTIKRAREQIPECEGLFHAQVRAMFNRWHEEGRALKKVRAYNNMDAFYVLTDEEIENELSTFIDDTDPETEPEVFQAWSRDLELDHTEINLTLKDSNGQAFDLTGCNVYWGPRMAEITNAQQGEAKFVLRSLDAMDLRESQIRIQKNGSQWMINMPQHQIDMIDHRYRLGDRPPDRETWAMPSQTLTETIPKDDGNWVFEAFMGIMGILFILAILFIGLGN